MHDTGQSAPGRLTRGCRVRTPITTGPRMILRDRNLPFAPSSSDLRFVSLGPVDGFDDDEAERKGYDGAVVSHRLLEAQRNALEALQLPDQLLDTGARPIERYRLGS